MATVLVTGGAGYVGAHCCLALAGAGFDVVVYDNFSNGHVQFARWGRTERGDIRDRARLGEVFRAQRIDVVLHCAALIEVGESVRDPSRFYDNNLVGALTVLDAMREAGVKAFVFSSTCATYGDPQCLPMDETHPQAPINPYGWSKLMVERAVKDEAAAHGLRYALMRYFNAAGAAHHEVIGERHDPESHAIPLALFTLLGRRERFNVFGADYDTRDGSCLRDYVHVLDLADAHVRAIQRLLSGGESLAANLGAGAGVTVLELLAAIERVTGRMPPHQIVGRRAGDPPALLADARLAQRELGWSAKRSIDEIIASAWAWHAEVEPRLFA